MDVNNTFTPEDLTRIKNGSIVKYKGITFEVYGFNDKGKCRLYLHKALNISQSQLQIVSEPKWIDDDCKTDTSGDFLYSIIHKKIREQIQGQTDITAEDLERMVEEALNDECGEL